MAMRHRALAILIVMPVLACGSAPEPLGPEAWVEPPDRPGPIELIGVMTESIHAGDSGVWVVPVDRAGDPPAFCVSYIEGRAREGDSCKVEPEPYNWNDETWPWAIWGWWIGVFVPHEQVSMHAFDEQGHPLAQWTGRMHEDAGYLTE